MSINITTRIVSRFAAIGFIIMGISFFTEKLPIEFVQHMVGFVLIALAILFWRSD